MKLSSSIRRNIDTLVIEHPAFLSARDLVLESVTDTINGLPAVIALLLGPTQAGKSKMLRTIAEAYPATRVDGRLQVPVLYISLPSGIAPKDLPLCVIEGMGHRLDRKRRSVAELFTLMCELLARASVKVILIDEANHLVDTGHRIPGRQVGDWFKDLNERTNVTTVLAGIPRLEAILKGNEQLRSRALRAFRLMPYRWDRREERLNFAGCVGAFLDIFKEHGCHIDMTMDAFSRHAYLVSAGHVGLLARFFVELAKQLREPRSIELSALQAAAAKLNPPGGVTTPAFSGPPPADDLLMHVLSEALAENDLVLPPDTGLAVVSNLRSRMRKAPSERPEGPEPLGSKGSS